MKIKTIEVSNFIGLARADIHLKTGVLVVSGSNAAGKSSLADAISCALLGKPRRVDVKKDLGKLLHDDAAKGRVTLAFAGDEGAEFRIPKGDHMVSEIAGAEFLPYVLDAGLFARQTEDERRTMLFKLTGLKASPKLVADKLLARGIDQALIDDVLPVVRNGFPAAAKEAYAKSTEAKGAWRQITGENWGVIKADGWSPERVEGVFDEGKHETALHQLDKCKAELNRMSMQLGELNEKRRTARGLVERRKALEETAGSLKRASQKLESDQLQLADWKSQQAEWSETIGSLSNAQTGVKCPCCDELLVIRGSELVKHDGKQADPSALASARASLAKVNETIQMLERAISNDHRDIAAANAATDELGLLQSQAEDVSDEQINSTQEAINALQGKITNDEQVIKRMEQVRDGKAAYDRSKLAAATSHKLVMDYMALGDALAPDGIPGELLNDALAPVNQSIEMLAGMCGWSKAVVEPDMSITFGGRLYGLCSESEKWRADCLIALAIAQISQLKLVLLDRFDVLDSKSRQRLLGMLLQLDKIKAMDTMIICGTMKQPMPASQNWDSVWLQNGLAETVTA